MTDPRLQKLAEFRAAHPVKFQPEKAIFKHIQPGSHIFIETGCGAPQHVVNALTQYAEERPKALYEAEILQLLAHGDMPYLDERFGELFRHNALFIGPNIRNAVNTGRADYTPAFLSTIPSLIRRRILPVDVALIQTSLPDEHGYLSLGINVDITRAAIETASVVIAQVNACMPRVHGETFVNIKDIDFIIPFDEPLLEFSLDAPDDIASRIAWYVARIVRDGDTLQVGYGRIPNAILPKLTEKNNLGIHTEFMSEGIVELMRNGVVDNSRKTLNRGKTVAAFCMGTKAAYEFLDDNPAFEFRPVDYTNNVTVIARQENMTSINSAIEIDLTGQATAESIGTLMYSGIGGLADFMRGSLLAPGGKTILVLPSTARDGEISRIVPRLAEGAGVTLTRGDIQYIVTEWGVAFLHGKNMRERTMDLISIAHPKFRPWLIEKAREMRLIFQDQAYIHGDEGRYPDALMTRRTTRTGLRIVLRPVKISDEPLLKDFFYNLSDDSMYLRFISTQREMHHEQLQKYCVIDYTKEMVILAIVEDEGHETVAGLGQYLIGESAHQAEVALAVRDDYQNRGIGTELMRHLTYIAKRNGLFGFTAEVLIENKKMVHVFETMGFRLEKSSESGIFEIHMTFGEEPPK